MLSTVMDIIQQAPVGQKFRIMIGLLLNNSILKMQLMQDYPIDHFIMEN